MNYIEELTKYLKLLGGKGIFVTSGAGKSNTMTASWGFCGVMWTKPILVAPIRLSRFTHGLIESSKEFSVSIPLDNSSNKALGFFGKYSGKDKDKYGEFGIEPVRCKTIGTNVMPGSMYHLECRVIYSDNIIKERLPEEINESMYKDSNYHTLFYGEILDAYKTDK